MRRAISHVRPLLDRYAARRRNCHAPGVAVVKIFPGCWHARPRQLKVFPAGITQAFARRMLLPGCRMPWRVPRKKSKFPPYPPGNAADINCNVRYKQLKPNLSLYSVGGANPKSVNQGP